MKLTTTSLIIFIILTLAKQSICDRTSDNSLSVNTHDVKLKLHGKTIVLIKASSNFPIIDGTLNIITQDIDIARINLTTIELKNVSPGEEIPIEIEAVGAGKTDIYSNTTNNLTDVKEVYFRITIHKVDSLDLFSTIIGWIYFLTWSLAFYPQAWTNWRRKSVIGLNFDLVALNLVGFTVYSVFNLGLYLIPEIKDEYSNRHPRGLNPIQVNDIVFAVHAVFMTAFTISQCVFYERKNQRVSTTTKGILGVFALFLTISSFLSGFKVIEWLDFLYYCSYVKLAVTTFKYFPQAVMNFRRKSTVGWSIGSVFFDVTGGVLSMLQMILNAYNYDDWKSIFGDPTKFGLGLISTLYDLFFLIQHYVLYRHSRHEESNFIDSEKKMDIRNSIQP